MDNTNAIAEKILNGLEKQKFADWYNDGSFMDYISGTYPKEDPKCPTKEKIIEDIKRLFNLR